MTFFNRKASLQWLSVLSCCIVVNAASIWREISEKSCRLMGSTQSQLCHAILSNCVWLWRYTVVLQALQFSQGFKEEQISVPYVPTSELYMGVRQMCVQLHVGTYTVIGVKGSWNHMTFKHWCKIIFAHSKTVDTSQLMVVGRNVEYCFQYFPWLGKKAHMLCRIEILERSICSATSSPAIYIALENTVRGLLQRLEAQGRAKPAAMVQKSRTPMVDGRKPRHSNDAERPSKGSKDMRDAATVSIFSLPPTVTLHDSFVFF